MAEGLKQCPFCGGHVQPLYFDPALGVSGIFCQVCKAVVKWHIEMEPRENYGENMRKWEERWNRRANDDQGTADGEDHANKAGD